MIQDEKKLDRILERFYNRYNGYNTEVLKQLGETIKKFDGIRPSDAYKIGQELKLGFEINDLINELSQISGKTIQEVNDLLDEVAKENVDFAETYYKAKKQEFIKYEDNMQLQNLVEAIKKQTNSTFVNIANSNNIGFTLKDKNGDIIYKPLTKLYNDLIDEAVYNVSTGIKDYQSAMRKTMNQLADSGVKIHEEKLGYKSGYNKRLDSAIKQDILTGIKQVNIDIQRQIGEELGTDGVEISAHFPCAEDHLDIQGRQYSNTKFEKINSGLDRPIGELNCRHFIFSIILGVNEPSYTPEQLRKYRQESLEKVNYKGKIYTKYEATQVQRKFETEIRRQKDRQIINRAKGDKEEVGLAQQRISQLTSEYNKFSKIANLDTYKNRLTVSGYRKIKV